jgi:hypothetical protein
MIEQPNNRSLAEDAKAAKTHRSCTALLVFLAHFARELSGTGTAEQPNYERRERHERGIGKGRAVSPRPPGSILECGGKSPLWDRDMLARRSLGQRRINA